VSGLSFFDTNVVLYAYTPSGSHAQRAEQLLLQGGVISVQVLNEMVSVARGKLKLDWGRVRQLVQDAILFCPNPRPITAEIHLEAIRISARYGFAIWDGLIVASALDAGCGVIYTEDMQHGQVIEGVRIVNPFL